MAVKGALRHSGRAGNVSDRHAVEAVGGKQIHRCAFHFRFHSRRSRHHFAVVSEHSFTIYSLGDRTVRQTGGKLGRARMDWLLTLCVIAASFLAAKAFSRTRRLAATILALKATVEVLDQRLSRFEDLPAGAPEAPSAEALLPEEAVGEATSFPAQIAPPLPTAPAGKGWEEILVENWLVWLGGVALALGGAFLVKFSIDYGLLTPAVRVALGVLLGLALWAGAEWLVWGEPVEARPSNISQALAAAGAATIFASLYAAYQLYGLLPS